MDSQTPARGSRPEISAVARELGLSDRTLQRRIIDDGATFRQLLLEARQELAHEYLNRQRWMSRKWHFCSATRIRIPSIGLSERGRDDTLQLRAALRRSETRQ